MTLPYNNGRDLDALTAPIGADEFDWDLDVEDKSAVKLMVHYFYHHNYPSKLPTYDNHARLTPENVVKGVMVDHAKMYAMAEKYQVPGLKTVALHKYQECLQETCAGYGTSIVIAFMSTPDTDQELRNEIVDSLSVHDWMVMDETLEKTVKEIPELVYALYRKLLEKSKQW